LSDSTDADDILARTGKTRHQMPVMRDRLRSALRASSISSSVHPTRRLSGASR
jgi:hypothetical protein